MSDELDAPSVVADVIDRGKGGARAHATPDEKQQGRLLFLQHRNISKVARALNRKRATIAAWMVGPEFEVLKKEHDARLLAEARDHVLHELREFRDDALQGMKRAIREGSLRGNHKPALETLLHARLLDPLVVEDSPRVVIQVGIKAGAIIEGLLPPVVKKEP
jgi:hypothetical protein